MLTYLTCAIIACAAYLAGLLTLSVRRDDRLREAERSALAATRACAEARRALEEERERLFKIIATRDAEIDGLDARLWDAEAELTRLRGTPGGDAA